MPSVTLDFVAKMAPTTVAEELDDETPDQESSSMEVSEEDKRARGLLLKEANYDASKVEDNGRCSNYISWQDYFMTMAFLTAERSKDPNTQGTHSGVNPCIMEKKLLKLFVSCV